MQTPVHSQRAGDSCWSQHRRHFHRDGVLRKRPQSPDAREQISAVHVERDQVSHATINERKLNDICTLRMTTDLCAGYGIFA